MRRGSVSSWEPWARRNSANMAQIAPTRSEFTTSDLGLTNIEYKRKGGCFLSHKKTATMIVLFILGVIAAGVIGAYFSPWTKHRAFTAFTLAEDDEIDGPVTPARFISSPSIQPNLYTIKLTPVLEEDTVKKFSGHVVVRFTCNSTEPLSRLVLNAKDITVSKAKLLSLDDDHAIRNVRFRKRRDDLTGENLNPNGIESSDYTPANDTAVANITESETATELGSAVLRSFSSSEDALNATSMDSATNDTALDSSNDNISTPPGDIVTLDNETSSEKGEGILPGSSEPPLVVQKISPVVWSRSMPPEIFIQSTEIPISWAETDTVDSLHVIYPGTPIQRGVYSLEITYEAKVDGESTFANVYELDGDRRWLLASKLEPLGPRALFPSFDDPNSKARFALSVARPKAFIALANMPLQSSDSVSDDWVMDSFEISPPLSSRNLAFMVGDLKPIRETTAGDSMIPLTLWGRNSRIGETHFIAEKMDTAIQTLNQFFSTPYTMPKLDVVAMPGLLFDGGGSTGLISIRESLFYMTDESPSIAKELAVKNLVKLIGEQWLGGLVSAKTLSDAWVLEGSLIFLQNLLAEKIDSTLDSADSFGSIQHDALESDSYEVSKTLDSKISPAILETAYPQNAYRKGACLIRMLHSVISDSGFRNGYKNFISRWINSSAGVSDFWKSMSNEAHWLPDGVSLDQVMTSWVGQGGFPVITVSRNYESGTAVVRQEQFAHDNYTISKRKFWYIPLTYISDGDDWSSPRKSWLKKEEKITVEDVGERDEKKWVLFNVNQTGFYRVNYELDNWKLLSSALNSATYEKFPVTTRTSLVDDALSLAWGGRLEYPTALNLIRYLREKETHHSPWMVALKNMIKLNNLLQNTGAYASFQEFMIKFISPVFEKVTTEGGESQLKLMAIEWACLIDNTECQSYLKNLPIVPTYLAKTHRCALAKFGGKSEWDFQILETSNAEDREIKLRLLAALPCFQVEWILQSLLTDILEGEKFDVAEALVLLQSFGENPMAARSAFKFVIRQWNEIFQRFSKSYKISKAFLVASINGIADEQDLKTFQIFKEEHYDKLKFMRHTIAVAEAEARSRSSWLKTNLLPVQAWLNDYIEQIS